MSVGTSWGEVAEKIERLLRGAAPRRAWTAAGRALRSRGARGDIPLLLHLAVLAAQYGEASRALSWVDEHEASLGPGGVQGLHDVVRVAVLLATKDFESARRIADGVDWKRASALPWAFNIRLLLAVQGNDSSAVLGLLHRPSAAVPTPPDFSGAYDRGNRLRILGLHFFSRGLWDRGMGCFRAALREFAKDPAVDARLKEVESLGWSGMAAHHGGDAGRAEKLLLKAIDGATALRHPFYRDSFRHELALVWAELDDKPSAGQLCLQVAEAARARASGTASDHFLRISALLTAADIAVDAGDVAQATRHADGAARLLAQRDHVRYRGYLHLVRGRIEVAAERPHRAFEEFDVAEEAFRSVGDGDLVGIAKVHLHRGKLHLRLRQVRAALSRAEECAEASRASRHRPMMSTSILFQSRLLLAQGLPRAGALYERILRSLGAVHDTATLLKILANLYLYSWELDGHLELTHVHLLQIYKLRDILDEATFSRLYRERVVLPVTRRAMERSLGLDLPQLDPQDD